MYVQLCNIFPTHWLESVFIPTSDECSSSFTFSPTLNTADLFDFSPSNACVEVSLCGFFTCIFLMINNVEHFLIILFLIHLYSSVSVQILHVFNWVICLLIFEL